MTPESLGFRVSREADEHGGTLVRMTDARDGRVLAIHYGAEGRIVAEQVSTAGGRLLSRRSIRTGETIEEEFTPVHRLTISRGRYGGGFDITIYRWSRPSALPEKTELRLGPDSTAACGVPSPVPNLDELLARSGDIVRFSSNGQPGEDGWVHLGSNVVAQGCENYPPNGNATLLFDFADAINTGARCLASLGDRYPGPNGPALRTMAAKMLGFFQPGFTCPFHMVCGRSGDDTNLAAPLWKRVMGLSPEVKMKDGDVGQSVPPDAGLEEWPLIAANLTKIGYWRDRNYARSNIFHETLHLLGIKHREDVDLIYLAQMCCFPRIVTSRPGVQNLACHTLTHLNPDDPDQKANYGMLNELLNRRKIKLETGSTDEERVQGLEDTLAGMDPTSTAHVRHGTTVVGP